jgi:hypothetical protein
MAKKALSSKTDEKISDQLEKEIKKWTRRLEKELKNANIKNDDRSIDFLENIKAYLKDSKYFYEKGDLVRSFEAIIWAWSWWEILKKIKGLLEM